MKTGLGLGCALVVGCRTVDEDSETRPVGEPVLSAAELAEARVAVGFPKHVKPILEERCLHCHNRKELPERFSLETRVEAFKGGKRIVPGRANESLLIIVLTTGNHAMAMPAVGTAPPQEEIQVLKRWIDAGADWPAGLTLRPHG
jgi:uncharacterized membrane protein